MTILLNKIKKILSATDYFNSLSMLRFQKEDEYKTISGGLLSLGIIVVIMVAFTREILVTMDRTSMQVKSNVVKVEVPTKARLNLRPQQNQMFALLIQGVSPSDSIRYFDVIAQIFDFNTAYPGRSPDSVAVKMGQCTDDHWTGFENVYTTKSIDQLFCPELGTNLDIFGKVTTGKQRNLKILASVCNPYSTDTRPCASQQQMSEFWTRHGGSTQFYLFYLNAILTPDQTDYKQIYFEQRQFGFIAPTFGNDVTLSLSDYVVSTDQSIWPFKDQINQSGLFAPNGLKIKNFPKTQSFPFYLIISIQKSTDMFVYQRTVQKLSTIFSYIGGVISSLLTAFFFMNRYTSFAFEMSIANELFQKQNKRQKQGDMTEFTQKEKDEQKGDQTNETFLSKNIFFYFKYSLFNFFKDKFKYSLNSDQMDYVKQCHEQMMKQLDIKRIIKRINCLQHCISNIINSQRLQDLLLTQPSAVQQIKKNRLTFEIIQKESILTQKEANQTSNCNQIMQDKICYQMSATALAKDVDGTLTKQLGEILNTLEQKSQISVDQIQIKRKKQQKDIVRNQPKASITKQLIITESFNQRKKQPQQQEDIYEIPIQFCNFQSQ